MIATAYRDVMVLTRPPAWVQRLMFGLLAPLGRAMGRRPCYPEYLESAEIVEPDPVAVALLTPDGRLAA